jgi:sugar-specific transcriptional regulator TrmB
MQPSTTNEFYSLAAHLGITLNEAAVYLFLLQHGLTAGAKIHPQLNMDKSSSYRALSSLLEKNLIYKVGEERNQQFGANPAEQLEQVIESKRDALNQAQNQLKTFIASLDSLTQHDYYQNNMTILKGQEGFKQWNLTRLQPGSTIIRELATRTFIQPIIGTDQEYDEYMDYYIRKRVSRKIEMRVLITEATRNDNVDITSKKDIKETRILPSNFSPGAIISTWADCTGFISSKHGEVLSIIIKDEFINNIVTQMYDFIWNLSEPKPNESGIT